MITIWLITRLYTPRFISYCHQIEI